MTTPKKLAQMRKVDASKAKAIATFSKLSSGAIDALLNDLINEVIDFEDCDVVSDARFKKTFDALHDLLLYTSQHANSDSQVKRHQYTLDAMLSLTYGTKNLKKLDYLDQLFDSLEPYLIQHLSWRADQIPNISNTLDKDSYIRSKYDELEMKAILL